MNVLIKNAVKAASIVAVLLSPVVPALAANVTGEVLAYDRMAGRLVLTDKSVFSLETMTTEAPTTLSAGDRVTIDFEGDEDGIRAINSITILAEGENI